MGDRASIEGASVNTNRKAKYRISDPSMFVRDGLAGDTPIEFIKGGYRVGQSDQGVNLNIIKHMPNWQPVEVTQSINGEPFIFRPVDKSWLLVVMPMRSAPLRIDEASE